MAAGFEIIEEPTFGIGGSFVPRADQKKFRSCFACVEGEARLGWETESSVTQGIPSADGAGKLVFEPFKDEKGRVNEIKYKGMRLREYQVPIESALQKDRHDAGISADACRRITSPHDSPATAQSVGRTLSGTSALIPPSQANFAS